MTSQTQPATAFPTTAQVEAAMRRAHQLRSDTMGHGFVAAFQAFVGMLNHKADLLKTRRPQAMAGC